MDRFDKEQWQLRQLSLTVFYVLMKLHLEIHLTVFCYCLARVAKKGRHFKNGLYKSTISVQQGGTKNKNNLYEDKSHFYCPLNSWLQ